jgi:glucose/arabinose dehydrogenase
MVRVLVVVAVLLCSLGATQAQVDFTARPVVSNLHVPWDMVEGPDGYIWYTERIGLLCRVHPDTGVVDTLLDMRDGVSNIVEIGLLSLALHPAFPEQPYVYVES